MKGNTLGSVRNRLLIFLIGAVVLLALLLIRVAWIQMINGEQYSKEAALQQTKDVVISSKRGTIYDRNMKELAVSASSETVTVCPREIKQSGKINEIATGLAAILEKDKDEVYAVLAKNSSYEVLQRKINKDKADAIREKGYPGVTLVEDFKRYYPGGTLASHVIGFVGTDNQGLAGIEMIYENYLKGVPGRIVTAKNAVGTNMPYKYEKYVDPENGINVVLTIDELIQRKAEDALKKAVENYQVENGAACIIMGAKTGEIYAMATYPTFDLNSPFTLIDEELSEEISKIDDEEERTKARTDALNKQWRNKAVVDAYEPGSTFKAMVAAMALEENLVALNETFVCNGTVRVASETIGCWNRNGHGTETFVNGVYNSCNPVFMAVGERLGTSKFYKYFKAFGFGDTTNFDLPGEAAGTFHSMDRFNEVELATASFGQGFTVTPLQLVTAYSAIANDGYMVKPHLIKSLVDDSGNVIQNFETETIRQVISRETADTICEILEGVASDGTSKNAYIEGFHIAGKTGTSEKLPRGNGKYVASFVGIAPANDPELICLVMLDEPMGSQYMGGAIAAPTFKEIMSEVLIYMQVENDSKIDYQYVPDVKGMKLSDAKKAIQDAGFEYVVKGEGETVISQTPTPMTALGNNAIVVIYTEEITEDYVVVPDLHGYFASDANQALINAGLNMRVKDSGVIDRSVLVGTQDPPAGTELPRGSVVTVEYNYTSNVH